MQFVVYADHPFVYLNKFFDFLCVYGKVIFSIFETL